MGIFSSLCAIGSSIIRGVGGILKSATEYIISNKDSILSGVADWIKGNIFGLDETPSYDSRKATVPETQKINELLEKCIYKYSSEAQKYDKLAKDIIDEHFMTIEGKLHELNRSTDKEIIDEYIFKSFQSNLKNINKHLDRIYSKQIANVFSLNNNKLLDILSLEKGSEKKEALRKLAINTIAEAHKKLREELSEFIKEQEEFIVEKLNSYMGNINNNYMIAKRETEKIIESIDEDKFYRLQIKNKYEDLEKKIFLLGEILEIKE